ncbi:MAG: glycosidase, partial [Candidatus Nealsonbacteria bacterium]
LYWEKLVYNAAAVRINGITYLLYRALGEDGISRIGLWWSRNGYHQDGRLLFPIFGPREDYELPRATKKRREEHRKLYGMVREVGGTEDPRVTLIDDTLYMTYTAYGDMVQLAMAKIEVGDFLKGIKECNSCEEWNSLWVRNGPVFKTLGDKDAVLFPVEEHKVQQRQMSSRKGENKFVTLFPELLEGKFALIHRIPPDMQILYTEELRNVGPSVGTTFFMSRPGMWDGEKVGAGAPPLRTKYGWLHIYHGVGKRNDKKVYRLGVILTSFDDPARILYASHIPVLEPEEDYEVNGWVPNVVFTCGVVPKHKDSNETLDENDAIMVYYGAADEVMGVAEAKIGELIPKELRE